MSSLSTPSSSCPLNIFETNKFLNCECPSEKQITVVSPANSPIKLSTCKSINSSMNTRLSSLNTPSKIDSLFIATKKSYSQPTNVNPTMNSIAIPKMNSVAIPKMNSVAIPKMNPVAIPKMNPMAIPKMNPVANSSI